MLRTLLREALRTTALLYVVSLAGFAALDATREVDWWGTAAGGARAGLSRDEALARALPRVWLSTVPDAQERTEQDLAALRTPSPAARQAALARIVARGTAALPTLLAALSRSRAPDPGLLEALARIGARAMPEDPPPLDPAQARVYWDRFDALRGLDFRAAYAERAVRRYAEHGGGNGAAQVERLGSFAVPALCGALERFAGTGPVTRLSASLAVIDPSAARPGAPPLEQRANWRAWCFARALSYEQLGSTERAFAHVTHPRFGRWWSAFWRDSLGPSTYTARPVLVELRERLPASIFCGGLSALLATALTLAFGGRDKRAAGARVLELFGALVPGLLAFGVGYVLLLQLLAPGRAASARLFSIAVGSQPVRVSLTVVLLAAIGGLWLRRPKSLWLVRAVRREAETWARDSRRPNPRQVLRHGARVGVASLLVPLGLAGFALPFTSALVEPLLGLRGMGALTLFAVFHRDASWAMVVVITAVPLMLAGHWSRLALLWALSPEKNRVSAPPPPPSEQPENAGEAPHGEVPEAGR